MIFQIYIQLDNYVKILLIGKNKKVKNIIEKAMKKKKKKKEITIKVMKNHDKIMTILLITNQHHHQKLIKKNQKIKLARRKSN